MMKNIKCLFGKKIGKIAINLIKDKQKKKTLPGKIFIKLSSLNCLKYLIKDLKIGLIILSTNKTTNTQLIIKLLSKEYKIAHNNQNVKIKDSNKSKTSNKIATKLLESNNEFGLFEFNDIFYRIKNPYNILKDIKPVFFVCTGDNESNINNGSSIDNKYLKLKKSLSKPLNNGLMIVNSDNPISAFIGKQKESDLIVNFYGLDLDNVKLNKIDLNNMDLEKIDVNNVDLEKIDVNNINSNQNLNKEIFCPKCGKNLIFLKKYNSFQGKYYCPKCGFLRPGANIKITKVKKDENNLSFRIIGNPYNYYTQNYFKFDFKIKLTVIKINEINIIAKLYEILPAISVYATFTKYPEKLNENLNKVLDNIIV
ncbi:MAG: hypothetical protein LBM96_13085 [Methanobrevibacter sp.]|jgi:predicted RNA-binding Zn-ribbon protein involved in translation (DUF1610 family)|nr:hypothetical protein [Candidatus Methanoflexus mossambicus]